MAPDRWVLVPHAVVLFALCILKGESENAVSVYK